MPIKIRCACGNILLAPEDRIGETGKCPACNRSIKVELPATEAEKIAAARDGGPQSMKFSPSKKKRSFLSRLIATSIYVFFLILLAFTTSIHYFSHGQITNLKFQQPYLQKTWAYCQETVLMIRTTQREYFESLWRQVSRKYRQKGDKK